MPIADNITIEFAWDPAKAKSNLTKHGVSFNQAASLILDPLAITVADLKHSENEDRWFTLGVTAGGTMLAIVHTYAFAGPDRASVRIISARLATRKEREQYSAQPKG